MLKDPDQQVHRAPRPSSSSPVFYLLGEDWQETARRWREREGRRTPPVPITVANRTETAARVAYALTRGKIAIPELGVPDRILHIDSRVMAKAERRVRTASATRP